MKVQLSADSAVSDLEYGRRDPLRWPRGTIYPQKLALTSPISSDCSVGIVRFAESGHGAIIIIIIIIIIWPPLWSSGQRS
jgi:hypothetical protein